MKLEVNGVEYTNFTSISADLRLDALSNEFIFEVGSDNSTPAPFKGGEPARVIVDGVPVIAGTLEIVGGGYDSRSHNITYSGRDKTGDIIDSTLDKLGDLRAPVSLKSIIEKVIANIGGDSLVIDNANPELFEEAQDLAAPEPGGGVFEFIEQLARHRQVLLTSDDSGNVVIEKTPGPSSNGTLQNIIGDSNNNIKSADFSYDETGRFNVYKFVSSLNPITLNKTNNTQISTIVSQKGAIIDTGIRMGRQLVLIAESSFSDNANNARALWEANIRKARGRGYSCTVQGYRPNPDFDIWRPNRLVNIVDELADINAEMLINSVSFTLSPRTGRLTTLTLIEKNAYTLTLNEPKSQELGDDLFA